jgi:hypothetical protein
MTVFPVSECSSGKASLVSSHYEMSHQENLVDIRISIPRIVWPQRAVRMRLAEVMTNDELMRTAFLIRVRQDSLTAVMQAQRGQVLVRQGREMAAMPAESQTGLSVLAGGWRTNRVM